MTGRKGRMARSGGSGTDLGDGISAREGETPQDASAGARSAGRAGGPARPRDDRDRQHRRRTLTNSPACGSAPTSTTVMYTLGRWHLSRSALGAARARRSRQGGACRLRRADRLGSASANRTIDQQLVRNEMLAAEGCTWEVVGSGEGNPKAVNRLDVVTVVLFVADHGQLGSATGARPRPAGTGRRRCPPARACHLPRSDPSRGPSRTRPDSWTSDPYRARA